MESSVETRVKSRGVNYKKVPGNKRERKQCGNRGGVKSRVKSVVKSSVESSVKKSDQLVSRPRKCDERWYEKWYGKQRGVGRKVGRKTFKDCWIGLNECKGIPFRIDRQSGDFANGD